MENNSGTVVVQCPPPLKKKCIKKKSAPPKCTPKFKQNGEAYVEAQRKIREFFSPLKKENDVVATTTIGLGR